MIFCIYLHIYSFECGSAKLDEIRRVIINFKLAGKTIITYVPEFGIKKYYVACACEKVYISPTAYEITCNKIRDVNNILDNCSLF